MSGKFVTGAEASEAAHHAVHVPAEEIVSAVAATFKVEPKALLSRSRCRRFARPRHVAMWLCLRSGKRSTTQVGRMFGRDHTSVMYGRNQVDRAISEGRPLGRTAALIASTLGIEPPAKPPLMRVVNYLSHVKHETPAS